MSAEIFVLGKKIRLLQPEGGFKASLDSVMLAAACPASPGDRVLDIGCGVGGASFCLLYRVETLFLHGIDIHPEYIEFAKKNADLNNNTDRSDFNIGDVRQFKFFLPEQRVDHVICNPPFLEAGTYIPSPDPARSIALGHRDEDIELKHWTNCAFLNLKPGGSLTIIHRADHIDRIIHALGKKFGQVEVFPLWPHAGEGAKRVIIRALKDRRSPAKIHAGIILHNADGSYTAEAEKVLREGARLF